MSGATFQRVVAGLILIIGMIWFVDSYACDDEAHLFARVAAGKQGKWLTASGDDEWLGDDDIAAVLSVGGRMPLYDWLWLDLTAQHNSQWTRGEPINHESEDELDSITVGLEVRWY